MDQHRGDEDSDGSNSVEGIKRINSSAKMVNILDPDDGLMSKFQKTLQAHLSQVDNRLSEEIFDLVEARNMWLHWLPLSVPWPQEWCYPGPLPREIKASIYRQSIGILSDMIGRKYSMLLMVAPFCVGWLLLIFADSVVMFYVGRFILGLSAGAFCVAAPMYSAETAESEIRGSLGSYFQLLLTVGILLSYIYLKKGNVEAARASFVKLRGAHYDVEPELAVQQNALQEAERSQVSFLEALKSRATIKGLIIGYGLMFFQQLSGVNAVIFYASDIFKQAGSSMTPSVSTIVVGVIQVIAVFVSTLIVDRLGRRILLLTSNIAMFLTTFILGTYFYIASIGTDVSTVQWLPLVSVCIFIILFSLGFGPIPWMMMGEIFAPGVKGVAASSACLFNWLMAFLVTKFYSDLKAVVGIGGTFWIFSVICAIGVFFIYFLVPETKGKSWIQPCLLLHRASPRVLWSHCYCFSVVEPSATPVPSSTTGGTYYAYVLRAAFPRATGVASITVLLSQAGLYRNA